MEPEAIETLRELVVQAINTCVDMKLLDLISQILGC